MQRRKKDRASETEKNGGIAIVVSIKEDSLGDES